MRQFLLTVLCFLSLFATCKAGEWTSLIAIELSLVTMQPTEVEKTKVPRSQCTVCKGTGKVKAGDTVTVVWRDCDNCVPEVNSGEAPKSEPKRQVLIFTASWCSPCQWMHKYSYPHLKNEGYTVGSEPNAQFRLIDFDSNRGLASQFNIKKLPTIISLLDGETVERHEKALNSNELIDLFRHDDPGLIRVKMGSLNDVRPKIDKIREMLALLGPSGALEIRPDTSGKPVVFPISTTTSITIGMPFKANYRMKNDVISFRFDTPPPVRYRFLRGSLTELEISADRVDVKLKGLPDGFFEINS